MTAVTSIDVDYVARQKELKQSAQVPVVILHYASSRLALTALNTISGRMRCIGCSSLLSGGW